MFSGSPGNSLQLVASVSVVRISPSPHLLELSRPLLDPRYHLPTVFAVAASSCGSCDPNTVLEPASAYDSFVSGMCCAYVWIRSRSVNVTQTVTRLQYTLLSWAIAGKQRYASRARGFVHHSAHFEATALHTEGWVSREIDSCCGQERFVVRLEDPPVNEAQINRHTNRCPLVCCFALSGFARLDLFSHRRVA